MSKQAKQERIDRLLDAIEFVKADEQEEAQRILRGLINEDADFEDAWLWMSVAVDSLDQSSVCLDNVLRVNPENRYAASALHRIREPERLMQKRRGRLLFYRDISFGLFWFLVMSLLLIMSMVLFTPPPV